MKGHSIFDVRSIFNALTSVNHVLRSLRFAFVEHRCGRAWSAGLWCGLSSLWVVWSPSPPFSLSPQQAACSHPRCHAEMAAGPGGITSHPVLTRTYTNTHSFTPLCSLTTSWCGISLFLLFFYLALHVACGTAICTLVSVVSFGWVGCARQG